MKSDWQFLRNHNERNEATNLQTNLYDDMDKNWTQTPKLPQ